ncbi:MAG: hypothetical protein HXS50_01645, partial [Theionarchaea archaeon]|nr:hypothetical protein [Theionarchaea archaeon]
GIAPESRGKNPYGIDLVTNLILHSLDRPLIGDVLSRREARGRISSFMAEKLLVISMLEWADLFGANTMSLSQSLLDLDSSVSEAVGFYLEQDYDSVMGIMDRVRLTINEIGQRAVGLKDAALFWVFLLEWLAVTATSMITGVVLWTLMVRRRMYRNVGTTRIDMLE